MMRFIAGTGSGYRSRVLVGLVCLGAGLITSLCSAPTAAEQAATADATHKIDDTWQGTLHVPQAGDLRIVFKVKKDDKGALQVSNYSIDQGGAEIKANSASFDNSVFKFAIQRIGANYEGKMSDDGESISGRWMQGPNSLLLLLERAKPETAWAIPTSPPGLEPMAADADPNFEVATIKPSLPDQSDKMMGERNSHFVTKNVTLADLIKFAYSVQDKQVFGTPSWVGSDKWDIEAQPDVPGVPNNQQARIMVQKLLADRFQLKFHKEKKEMSAYVLTAGSAEQKMTRADSSEQRPHMTFHGFSPVYLTVQHATMGEVCQLFQAAVLDRPVVDQTALLGRWTFQLKWTADESQLGGLGVKAPLPSDAADAPPPLFTAIQEQLGLKLVSQKVQVEVIVIDQLQQPSPN
jgi:uncharacterized protein (TIGR03435 family)